MTHVNNATELKKHTAEAAAILRLMEVAQQLSPDNAAYGAMLMLMGAACLAKNREVMMDGAAIAYNKIHGEDGT